MLNYLYAFFLIRGSVLYHRMALSRPPRDAMLLSTHPPLWRRFLPPKACAVFGACGFCSPSCIFLRPPPAVFDGKRLRFDYCRVCNSAFLLFCLPFVFLLLRALYFVSLHPVSTTSSFFWCVTLFSFSNPFLVYKIRFCCFIFLTTRVYVFLLFLLVPTRFYSHELRFCCFLFLTTRLSFLRFSFSNPFLIYEMRFCFFFSFATRFSSFFLFFVPFIRFSYFLSVFFVCLIFCPFSSFFLFFCPFSSFFVFFAPFLRFVFRCCSFCLFFFASVLFLGRPSWTGPTLAYPGR